MKTKQSRIRIDADRHEVFLDGTRLELAPKEAAILTLLISQPKCWSRDQLLEEVWGGQDKGMDLDTRTVDQHVSRLRRILHRKTSGKIGGKPDRGIQGIIETVTGRGYRIAVGI